MGCVVVMEEVVEVDGVLVVNRDMGVFVVVKRVSVWGCCGAEVEVKSVRGCGCFVVEEKRLSGCGCFVVEVKSVIGCGCVGAAVVVAVKSGGGGGAWGCVGVEWSACWGGWGCGHMRRESPSTMNTTFSPPPSLKLSSLSLNTSCKIMVMS